MSAVQPKPWSDTLQGRDFLSLGDVSPAEIEKLIDLAVGLKNKKTEVGPAPLAGKTLAMIFDKPSTRTRVSFEAGMIQLGGHALSLSRNELQLGRGETLADTARTLSRYVDGILIRTHSHATVVELARCATVPVINGLTDRFHPCQALADLLTLREKKGRLAGLKMAYVGDGNNVLHSLLHAAAATGLHLAVATPPGYEPDPEVVDEAKKIALDTGAELSFFHEPKAAVHGADAVYTDVWISMGHEEEKERRIRDFQGFRVDSKLMACAKEDALFLHCLPAYRGLEVSEEVIDGPQSVVFDQAENRLHAQKALLLTLLG